MSSHRTRNLVAAALAMLSLSVICSDAVLAAGRCPAGDSGCTIDNYNERMQDIVRGGSYDMWSDKSTYDPSVDGVKSRVKRGYNILKNCLECGTDAVKDGINRFSGVGRAQ